MAQSIYEPLEIRLLEILPPLLDNRFKASCKLSVVSLDDKPTFTALSYVWGEALITEAILLNGERRQVRSNLAEALKELSATAQREPKPGFAMQGWADALCINQDDVPEKNQQVSLMADIFSSANQVLVWLGAADWIPTAIETLKILSDEVQRVGSDADALRSMEWLRRHPDLYSLDEATQPNNEERQRDHIPIRRWAALHESKELPYWSRMWIFQETVLSHPRGLTLAGPGGARIRNDALDAALEHVALLVSCLAEAGHRLP